MSHHDSVFGYVQCRSCPTAVWDVVAHKTDGLCVPCFNDWVNSRLAPIEAMLEGRPVPVVPRRHRSGDKQAQRLRERRRPEIAKQRAQANLAGNRALRRLKRLFPELYSCFLAQERDRLGLPAWSLDRLLEPGDGQAVASSLDFADAYHSAEE